MALSLPIASAASIAHEPGFKFTPTDEDIVVHSLRPRTVNEPVPSTFIVDVDILCHNPWDLLPEGYVEKYFFSQRVMKWPLGNQWNRGAGHGYWKTSGKDVPIFSRSVNGGDPLMIGLKRTLVFYHGKSGIGENTEWVTQEYRLAGAGLATFPLMRPSGSNNSGECSSAAAVIGKGVIANVTHCQISPAKSSNDFKLWSRKGFVVGFLNSKLDYQCGTYRTCRRPVSHGSFSHISGTDPNV